MYVILCPSDGHGNHFVILTNPGQVSPQPRLPLFRDGVAAVLRAEDQMDVVPREGMRHCVAPSGLYTIPILAPTAPAVGYDVSSLAGLAATHQTLAACASERKPRLLFARFLFHPRIDPRVQRPLVLSSHFLSLPNWGVALPNGVAVSPVLCPSGAQSGGGEACICCARI